MQLIEDFTRGDGVRLIVWSLGNDRWKMQLEFPDNMDEKTRLAIADELRFALLEEGVNPFADPEVEQ